MPADRGFPAPDPASPAHRECPRWGADRRGLPRGPSQRRAPRLAASPGGTRTAPASARPLSTPAPGRGGPASCLPTWEEPGRSRAAFASREAAGQRWGMARGLLTLLFVMLKILSAQQTLENTVNHVNLESTWIMSTMSPSVRDVLPVTASLVFRLQRHVPKNGTQNAPVQRTIFAVLYHVLHIASDVTRMPPWGIAAVVILVIVFLGSGALSLLFCKRKRKSLTCQQNPGETLPEIIIPLVCTDVDLSSHIPIIAEEMTLPQVKKFVRYRQIPDPVIDQVLQDNVNDTSEQKIKLLQAWYQSHGIKGAYGTLLSSLRTLKMCAVADKIEEKLKTFVSSNQEGGQSYNDDIEQRKTCSQEGGKSYHDNAELSKTYSEGLEET
uniref:Death domain-containing protein n=1 Tax=Anser brachyrhynchus TaxID=132585 RepID=A0A8B9C504_9AVES